MGEKAKLVEHLAEESFLMKRQIAEKEAERLNRAKVFEESESGDGEFFPQTKEARPNK